MAPENAGAATGGSSTTDKDAAAKAAAEKEAAEKAAADAKAKADAEKASSGSSRSSRSSKKGYEHGTPDQVAVREVDKAAARPVERQDPVDLSKGEKDAQTAFSEDK